MKKVFIAIMMIFLIQIVAFGESNTYVIGVQAIPEYLPESQYKKGEYSGFGREIFEMFGGEYGYEFIFKALPLKRLYNDFVNEKVDFKYPDNLYWSADVKAGKNITYSEPIVNYIDGVMVIPENLGKGLDRFKKLATPLGYTPFPYLKMIESGEIKLMENPNFQGLLRAVIFGIADGAYVNIAVGNYYMNEIYNDKKLVFDNTLPYTKSTRHFSTIKYPNIVNEFNDFLIKEHEQIEELKKKYKIEDFILE